MTNASNTSLAVPIDQLLEASRLKLAVAREHSEALGDLGITTEFLKQFEADIETAVAFPSLVQQRNELKSLTAIKNEKLKACVDWGRKLRFRMSIAFESQKPVGMQFPSKEWNQSEKNESKLITLWPTLLQLARTQAAALAPVGQKPADIEHGEHLLAELITANSAQEEYNLKRTSITAARRVAYRKLYETVNRINRSGQLIFGAESPTGRLFRSDWTVVSADDSADDPADDSADMELNLEEADSDLDESETSPIL